jgi:hypothetical protein
MAFGVIYGSRLYGRVHAVPGVFYVSTRFVHLFFVPLIPTASWIVLDDKKDQGWLGSNRKGLALGCIRWSSVGMAWLRLLLLAVAMASGVWAAAVISLGEPWWKALFGVAGLVASLLGIAYSYRVARATLKTLDQLALLPGVPKSLIGTARLVLRRNA